jgi:hypothetical protein
VRRRFTPPRLLRKFGEPIERLVQANIALIIVQAFVIRLSVELAGSPGESPDSLVLLGILVSSIGAGAIIFVLRRIIRSFPHRGARLALAFGSLLLQAGAFQLIHAYAS